MFLYYYVIARFTRPTFDGLELIGLRSKPVLILYMVCFVLKKLDFSSIFSKKIVKLNE